MRSPAKRYEHLDSLRGLAAFLVLWMHGAERMVEDGGSGVGALIGFEIPDYLHFGRVGVVLFFALSGFLIAKSLEGENWKFSFPLKRFFRLYPIYIVSIISALLLMNPRWDPLLLLANLTMLPTLFGQDELMGLYWTLQTEVIFYGVFYFITWFRLGSSRKFLYFTALFFTAVFMAEQLLVSPEYLDSLPLMIKKLAQHLGIMFWGACLYKSKREEYGNAALLGLTGFILLPSMVAGIEYGLGGFRGSPPVMMSYLTAVVVCYLVFYFRFSNRLFGWIGRIGYSVYLNHGLVLFLYIKSGISPGFFKGMFLYVMATLAVSWVSYRLIEAPGIRVSRKLVNRVLETRSRRERLKA